ncbi:GNAT family N-acetyltransferase [Paraburkholderia hayleyella]|uniref:GNAT family N-acetyltransferase n=1 Tax=Paraburkholderia hayleyella TaxID=2152889 RepID=UPI0012914DD3|nr:GNAT family N-acetyltransferase [Paraburkholderia hayleyella]
MFAMHKMTWRAYEASDGPALAALFQDAVLHLAAATYPLEALLAWSAVADDRAAFSRRLARGVTLVALRADQPQGFAQLYPENNIEMLYVVPSAARQGLGHALLMRLERIARHAGARRLTARVSLGARACFEHAGFQVLGSEIVQRHGASLHRFRMEKPLDAAALSL